MIVRLTGAIVGVFAATSVLILTTEKLEASRARPRVIAASENVRLAIPHLLKETADGGAMGLDFDEPQNRDQALSAAAKYVQVRRAPGKKSGARSAFERECKKHLKTEAAANGSVLASFCTIEEERTKKSEGPAEARRTKSEKRGVADQLLGEHWEAVTDIPYQSVVGIVGAFKTKAELMQMGQALGAKSECVGSKAATAIAYKLEEYFPDADAVKVARSLYAYASGCGTDFAAAKASYRLALLDVWQNQCERVPKLMLKVEQTPDAGQFRSRAKYWRAYCSEILGEHESSLEAREDLLFEFPMTFHNLAANSNQGHSIDWITRDVAAPIAFRSLVRPEMNGLIAAVEALVKLKATDLAADIVDRSAANIQMFEPEVRLYLAALMHKHGQALAKFKVLGSLFQDSPQIVSGATMRLYFPLWFFDIVGPQSGATLDPLLVTALIRQESAFNTRARSRVGARGLMQLMPATAKMLASVRTSKLFDPMTNVTLGTKYLRKRLAQYNGDVELTLAAYNAGFSRVDDWKKRYPTENRILFLDLIPFRETRDYVSSILRNYYWYTKLYGTDAVVALQRSMHQPNVAAKTLSERAPSADAGTLDLSSTFQAITRAQAGLVTALHTPNGTAVPAAAAAVTAATTPGAALDLVTTSGHAADPRANAAHEAVPDPILDREPSAFLPEQDPSAN